MSAALRLSTLIYPKECVQEAILAYSGICSAKIRDDPPGGLQLEISVSENTEDEGRAIREFLNYLLDLSVERNLTKV